MVGDTQLYQPNIAGSFAGGVQAGQQQRAQQQELAIRQHGLEDDRKIKAAMNVSVGQDGKLDWDAFAQNMTKAGVSPERIQKFQAENDDHIYKLATSQKLNLDNNLNELDAVRGLMMPIAKAPPQQRPVVWQAQREEAIRMLPKYKDKIPEQYPGDEAFQNLYGHAALGSAQVEEALKLRAQKDFENNLRSKTITTAQGEMGFNPDTGDYDRFQGQGVAKPVTASDRATAIYAKDPRMRTNDENAFIRGYEKNVDVTKTQPGVLRVEALNAGRPLQVVGNDGNVNYSTAGNAIASGASAPSSIPFQVQKSVVKDFTSGKSSQTLNAFNTAMKHLDALDSASTALGNGKLRVLNSIAAKYGVETGASAPAVFQATRTAVAGEIAKAFKGSGATDQEIGEINDSINRAQSPSQLHDVVGGYRQLLQSKKENLQKQFNEGMKGKPAFDTPPVVPKGHVRIQASDGSVWDVKRENLRTAQERDPGLQVLE
jgi:hypothetical protein